MCWPAAQLEVAKRKFAALHEDEPYHDGTFTRWAAEFSWAFPFHFTDGTSIHMSPVERAPWDDFTEDVNATPDRPEGWGEGKGEES